MKFTRPSEFVVDIYGTEYKLKKPTTGIARKYGKAGLEEGEAIDNIVCMLEECGLPKEVSLDMAPEHLNELIGELIPQKK